MGVPSFYRWLCRKYPRVAIDAVGDEQLVVNGQLTKTDTSAANPNNIEFDNLYLDMNGIIHPCCNPSSGAKHGTVPEMFLRIFAYIDRIFSIVRPRKVLYMAIDGVAPRAKMNQQRQRRFRAAQERQEHQYLEEELRKMYDAAGKSNLLPPRKPKAFDSNVITPGTAFMANLSEALRHYVADRVSNDPGWKHVKVIFSDATVPGEGEHKIMHFIRNQRSQPDYNANTVHCLYGMDADLIMLGLASHEPRFYIVREVVMDRFALVCPKCKKNGHHASECRGSDQDTTISGPSLTLDHYLSKQMQQEHLIENGSLPLVEFKKRDGVTPYQFLSLRILREYLHHELHFSSQLYDLERAIDDWVFLCFFVGNDFLPHLPSLEIRDNAIGVLTKVWKSIMISELEHLEQVSNHPQQHQQQQQPNSRQKKSKHQQPLSSQSIPKLQPHELREQQDKLYLTSNGDIHLRNVYEFIQKFQQFEVAIFYSRSKIKSDKDRKRKRLDLQKEREERRQKEIDDRNAKILSTKITSTTNDDDDGKSDNNNDNTADKDDNNNDNTADKDDNNDTSTATPAKDSGSESEIPLEPKKRQRRSLNSEQENKNASSTNEDDNENKIVLLTAVDIDDDNDNDDDDAEEESEDTLAPSRIVIQDGKPTKTTDKDGEAGMDDNGTADIVGATEDVTEDGTHTIKIIADGSISPTTPVEQKQKQQRTRSKHKMGGDELSVINNNIQFETTLQKLKDRLAIGPPSEDTVRFGEANYEDRYYSHKFHIDIQNDHDAFNHIHLSYITGLRWVLHYYYKGCSSWDWYYPYHYAPLITCLAQITYDQYLLDTSSPLQPTAITDTRTKHVISTTSLYSSATPILPFEQLLSVFPAASSHALPTCLAKLMTEADSEIADYYPAQFGLDMNHKKYLWQGVILLPFIDMERLQRAVKKVAHQLNYEEMSRNRHGVSYFYSHFPLDLTHSDVHEDHLALHDVRLAIDAKFDQLESDYRQIRALEKKAASKSSPSTITVVQNVSKSFNANQNTANDDDDNHDDNMTSKDQTVSMSISDFIKQWKAVVKALKPYELDETKRINDSIAYQQLLTQKAVLFHAIRQIFTPKVIPNRDLPRLFIEQQTSEPAKATYTELLSSPYILYTHDTSLWRYEYIKATPATALAAALLDRMVEPYLTQMCSASFKIPSLQGDLSMMVGQITPGATVVPGPKFAHQEIPKLTMIRCISFVYNQPPSLRHESRILHAVEEVQPILHEADLQEIGVQRRTHQEYTFEYLFEVIKSADVYNHSNSESNDVISFKEIEDYNQQQAPQQGKGGRHRDNLERIMANAVNSNSNRRDHNSNRSQNRYGGQQQQQHQQGRHAPSDIYQYIDFNSRNPHSGYSIPLPPPSAAGATGYGQYQPPNAYHQGHHGGHQYPPSTGYGQYGQPPSSNVDYANFNQIPPPPIAGRTQPPPQHPQQPYQYGYPQPPPGGFYAPPPMGYHPPQMGGAYHPHGMPMAQPGYYAPPPPPPGGVHPQTMAMPPSQQPGQQPPRKKGHVFQNPALSRR